LVDVIYLLLLKAGQECGVCWQGVGAPLCRLLRFGAHLAGLALGRGPLLVFIILFVFIVIVVVVRAVGVLTTRRAIIALLVSCLLLALRFLFWLC